MERSEVLKNVEFILLKDGATAKDYAQLCAGAKEYDVAAVCVPSSWVSYCRQLLPPSVNVCAVIGFPSGQSLSEAKIFEACLAIECGANEIEVVINLNHLLSADWGDTSSQYDLKSRKSEKILDPAWRNTWFDGIRWEIEQMRQVCTDGVALKVSIEVQRLRPVQMAKLCQVISEVGVDYIKTSSNGRNLASEDKVGSLREYVAPEVKIIATELTDDASMLDNTKWFLRHGCARVGSEGLIAALGVKSAITACIEISKTPWRNILPDAIDAEAAIGSERFKTLPWRSIFRVPSR